MSIIEQSRYNSRRLTGNTGQDPRAQRSWVFRWPTELFGTSHVSCLFDESNCNLVLGCLGPFPERPQPRSSVYNAGWGGLCAINAGSTQCYVHEASSFAGLDRNYA